MLRGFNYFTGDFMLQMKKIVFCCCMFFFSQFTIAQDLGSFDPFGDSSSDMAETSGFGIDFGGSVKLGTPIFFTDFKDFSNIRGSSLISANFHLNAYSPVCEVYASVHLDDTTLPFNFTSIPKLTPTKLQVPRFIDEIYLQGSFGPVIVGGGIKKMTWGRADSFSILDIINPKDFSDITITDNQKLKKARPLLFLSAYLPMDMKLEFVFLPIFEGNTYAITSRSATDLVDNMVQGLFSAAESDTSITSAGVKKSIDDFKDGLFSLSPNIDIDSGRLRYAQAGMRYTAIFDGYHDVGLQYYYGFLPTPGIRYNKNQFVNEMDAYSMPDSITDEQIQKFFTFDYTPVHQIGFDYGLAFGPVSIRTELAALITHDIKGTDPSMYNPSIAWNFGIDYTTPIGLMINVCVAEDIMLLWKNAQKDPYDMQYGKKMTDTHIMLLLTQTLLRGAVTLNMRSTMHVERLDFTLAPSFEFMYGSLIIGVETGFFFGKNGGANKNYITASFSYNF